ncbi:MAG: cytochrome c [Planctomycetes bacterium]|nr:cytochrome c [Planctomycetota bacterium]
MKDNRSKKTIIAIIAMSAILTALLWRFVLVAEAFTGDAGDTSASPVPDAPLEPTFDSVVERGKWLFERNGCFACHGEAGIGGVALPNYAAGTVPDLNYIAERMTIYSPEDAKAVIDIIESRTPFDKVQDPPYPRFAVTKAQYDSIRQVISNGSQAGSADPSKPPPPINMPAWKLILSDEDIDAIISYLISLYPWDE